MTNFEKKDYRKGDIDKMLKAQVRALAEREGALPELDALKQAAQAPQPDERPKPDYRAGDPEKLKAAREKLAKLYPTKKEEGQEAA